MCCYFHFSEHKRRRELKNYAPAYGIYSYNSTAVSFHVISKIYSNQGDLTLQNNAQVLYNLECFTS